MAVNMLGCLMMGFFAGLADHRRMFDPQVRMFLFVGILGGFTTFSAFANETATLLRNQWVLAAWLNVGLQVLLGLTAVWVGGMVSRLG